MNFQSGFRMKHRQVRGWWDRFWFTKQDPSLVGLIRVAVGVMIMYSHAVWGLGLHDFFGSHAWQAPAVVQDFQSELHLSYLWFVSDEWLWLAHAAAFVVLLAFTLGFLTRLTSILSAVILISYVRRQPAATFGFDQITAFLTLYLAYGYFFTPAIQRAFSMDRWIFCRWRDRDVRLAAPKSAAANATLRLIQIQMCVVYFFAGIAKMQGEAWWTGEAMWLAFASEEYANSFSMLWTWQYPAVLAAAGHVTVFWEVSFAALIWNKYLRPLYLFGGLCMHLGIGMFLSMWTFGLIMIVGCSSFTSTVWVGSLFTRRHTPNAEGKVSSEEEVQNDFASDATKEQEVISDDEIYVSVSVAVTDFSDGMGVVASATEKNTQSDVAAKTKRQQTERQQTKGQEESVTRVTKPK